MNQTEMQSKIENLVKDEEYMKKLLSLGSADAISKELEKDQIELSPDELRNIYTLVKKKQSGELTDAELENVAGGFPWIILPIIIGCASTGTIIGTELGCD